jgi:hypothetical protein
MHPSFSGGGGDDDYDLDKPREWTTEEAEIHRPSGRAGGYSVMGAFVDS